jgi:hypothetical protein
MARDNFFEKSDGPFRTPKTFVELKNVHPNFVYNKRTNYNLATLKNVNVSRVKLFMEEQISNALKNNKKLVE